MTTKAAFLKDLLIASKDGDWGKGSPTIDHTAYQVIRGTDFAHVKLGDISDVPIRHLPNRTVDRRRLQYNDILIETAGGSPTRPTGRTLLVTKKVLENFSHPVTCASFARFMRIDPDKADPRYIYWFLTNLYNSGEIETWQVQHTGVARFQFTEFARNKPIPLPELHVQNNVADTLEAIDALIYCNTQICLTSDSLATAILLSAINTGHTLPLGDVAEISMGTSPPSETFNSDGEGVVFYQGNRDFGFRYPKNRLWTTNPRRFGQRGDTLASVRAPVGSLNMATEKVCIGRGLASIRSAAGTPSSLFHTLKAFPAIWSPYDGSGTVFGSINRDQVHSLRIPMVTQDAPWLESRLAALDKLVEHTTLETSALERVRDELLPQLVSGRIQYT